MMDSLHASLLDGDGKVHPPSIEPFAAFARTAVAGKKLFVLTHSAIRVTGYASTTQSADALLDAIGLEARKVDPDEASPPDVNLPAAMRAFPKGDRRWMRVERLAEKGGLKLYACGGLGPEDHIAHLAQMSVTVLPPLAKRWR
jgi:hypothetical protein